MKKAFEFVFRNLSGYKKINVIAENNVPETTSGCTLTCCLSVNHNEMILSVMKTKSKSLAVSSLLLPLYIFVLAQKVLFNFLSVDKL